MLEKEFDQLLGGRFSRYRYQGGNESLVP